MRASSSSYSWAGVLSFYFDTFFNFPFFVFVFFYGLHLNFLEAVSFWVFGRHDWVFPSDAGVGVFGWVLVVFFCFLEGFRRDFAVLTEFLSAFWLDKLLYPCC